MLIYSDHETASEGESRVLALLEGFEKLGPGSLG